MEKDNITANNEGIEDSLTSEAPPDKENNARDTFIDNDYSSIDEDTSEIEQNIKLIKERTFNKELKGLVEKITSHESGMKPDEINNKNINDLSEEDLLKLFHSLFYKSVNLIGLNSTNTSFNPYLPAKYFFKQNFEKNIDYEMKNLSLPDYAILSYNLAKKCYLPTNFYIDAIEKENLFIDISEELYTEILNSKYGIMLDQNYINNNAFMKKKFTLKTQKNSQNRLYIVSVKNLTSNLLTEMNINRENNNTTAHLFKILMIQISGDSEFNNPELIYNEIIKKLPIHFLLLEKSIISKIIDIDIEDMENIFSLIMYYIQIFAKFNDSAGYIIKCRNYFIKENIFTFRYLMLKLKNNLPSKSIVSQVAKDKILILTQKKEYEIIEDIVKEYNSINNNILTTEVFKSLVNDNLIKLLFVLLS